MKMSEITGSMLGYNSNTKNMSGIVVLYYMVGYMVIIERWWGTDEYNTENIHHFVKKYKYSLKEYLDKLDESIKYESGLLFLPYKDNKGIKDIIGYIETSSDLYYVERRDDLYHVEYIEDSFVVFQDEPVEEVVSWCFNMCKVPDVSALFLAEYHEALMKEQEECLF